MHSDSTLHFINAFQENAIICLLYSGNVAMVYTVQIFLGFLDRIAPSCLLSFPTALQPRPKILNSKPFDIMTVKQTLLD